jgi:hypothetical protein
VAAEPVSDALAVGDLVGLDCDELLDVVGVLQPSLQDVGDDLLGARRLPGAARGQAAEVDLRVEQRRDAREVLARECLCELAAKRRGGGGGSVVDSRMLVGPH